MANQTAHTVDQRHQGSYPGARSQNSPGPDVLPEIGEATNQASENPPDTRLAVGNSESVRHGTGKVVIIAADTG